MQSSKYAPKPSEHPAPPAPTAPEAPIPEPQPTTIPDPVPAENSYSMDPMIDEFAQTRPPDDLFDDDFTPITESQAVYDTPTPAPAPEPQIQWNEPNYTHQAQERSLPKDVPRGPRGVRGGRRGGGGLGRGNTHASPVTASSPPKAKVEETPIPPVAIAEGENVEEAAKTETPTGPKEPTKPPVTSVRGDRSLTGGPKKTKLTPDELNAKLAQMSLKNAALTAAHEKAQKDEESFKAREQVAVKKRKEEEGNRKVMMSEREQNRLRKLKAVGGREWDAEKKEEDFREPTRGARRGAHGGVAGSRYADAPATQESSEDVPVEERFRGGRGGRARGRGGRGGRGAHDSAPAASRESKIQPIPSADDFPTLPATETLAKTNKESVPPTTLEFPNKKKPQVQNVNTRNTPEMEDKSADLKGKPRLDTRSSFGFSPSTDKRSWADQVDAASP